MRRKTGRWLALTVVIALAGSVASAVTIAQPAEATSGADFDPGNIISDSTWHDTSAMNSAQVQSFLSAQVAGCSNNNCLRNYAQATYNKPSTTQCAAYSGSSSESAATIIVRVSVACRLNPQVMLVTLQKEQALITAKGPSDWALAHATGYGCPDTNPCNPAYAGFFDQVYGAAAQFGRYETYATSYAYQAHKVVNILYNPNAACGSKPVYIQNQATANLYIYTPYTPNAAALNNLYGTGDGCSAYGNRNFWRIFSDWFGSPTGPKATNGSLDAAEGVLGGIQVQGWAVDPYNPSSAYVWVNVDGNGGPVPAQNPLPWIGSLYPGMGQNHGYDYIVSASPGTHSVCALQLNGTVLGCKTVVVPKPGTAAGSLDSVTTSVGKISVSGWDLDTTKADAGYLWVNVDGSGRSYPVDKLLSWTQGPYPQSGTKTGFAVDIPSSYGTYRVCVYGVGSVKLGCKTASVPFDEDGSIVTATGVLGGIDVAGWSLDQRHPQSQTYVWLNVDGVGHAVRANADSPTEALAKFPAATYGTKHGFIDSIPAQPGNHVVCATGTSQQRAYPCVTVKVPNNEVGSFDSLTAPDYSHISLTGWSLDQRIKPSTYIWVTVDGKGFAARADVALNWIDLKYHRGANHGFSVTVPAVPGSHTVCVTGTAETVSYGCKSVTVPSSVDGSFDTLSVSASSTPTAPKAKVTGWAADRLRSESLYVWINVDGHGGPVAANKFLNWVNGLYPGVGDYHGFDAEISISPGTHSVCATVTQDSVNLGCKTITVP